MSESIFLSMFFFNVYCIFHSQRGGGYMHPRTTPWLRPCMYLRVSSSYFFSLLFGAHCCFLLLFGQDFYFSYFSFTKLICYLCMMPCHIKKVFTSIIKSEFKFTFLKNGLPRVRSSKRLLDSGFQIPTLGFQIPFAGFRIPRAHNNWIPDSVP